MKYLLSLTVLFFLTQIASAQKLDSLAVQKIANKLIDQSIEGYLDKNIERKGDCVYDKKEGMILSCISADWEKNWSTDFDGDGNEDVVIQITDEGLGGGGNAFGYSFEVVTLDENKEIKAQYSLFGGGKLSYALLSIDKMANGKIYATYERNMQAFAYSVDATEIDTPISFEFFLENDKLTEKSYKKCPIALMNKSIFKENTGLEIKRSLDLDDSYNMEQGEYLLLNDGTNYYASISGCEDINLYFTHTIPFRASLEANKNEIKKTWLEHVQFLKENTRYQTVLQELYQKLDKLNAEKIPLHEYKGSQLEIKLSNNWRGLFFLNGNAEQGSFITIRLDKLTSKESPEFWEALKRKQK